MVRDESEEIFADKIVNLFAELVREPLVTHITPLGADPVFVAFSEVVDVE